MNRNVQILKAALRIAETFEENHTQEMGRNQVRGLKAKNQNQEFVTRTTWVEKDTQQTLLLLLETGCFIADTSSFPVPEYWLQIKASISHIWVMAHFLNFGQ